MMPASISEYVPQLAGGRAEGARRGRAWAVWGALAGGALALVAVLFAAPLAASAGQEALARAVYRGLHAVCHQMPERSFHVAGHPLAVCARCSGIYVGFAAAALFYPFARPLGATDTPRRAWLLLAALPTALDFGLNFLGLWENTHYSRAATGALLGAVVALYVVPGLVDAASAGVRTSAAGLKAGL